MANTHTSGAGADNPAQWSLRVGDQTLYGPVSLDRLVAWAREGRIAPGNQVSKDRRHWIAAESFPELEMRWMIQDGAGQQSGPYNRAAIDALIHSGRLPADTPLIEVIEIDPPNPPSKTPPTSPPQVPSSEPESPSVPKAASMTSAPTPSDPEPKIDNAPSPASPLAEDTQPIDDQADPDLLANTSADPQNKDSSERERARRETLRREWDAERKRLEQRITRLQSRLPALEKERDTALVDAEAFGDLKQEHHMLTERYNALREAHDVQRETVEALQQSVAAQAAMESPEALRGALEQERLGHAQTLQFANERDVALRGEIEQLQTRLATLEASTKTSGDAGFPEPLVALVRQWISMDREAATQLRDQAVARQEALQAVLRDLSRANDNRSPSMETHESESDRQLNELRQEHQKATATARERERELLRHVRVLEAQEVRLREQLQTFDATEDNPHALRERLQQSERNLERTLRQHQTEHDQWLSTEKALSSRIEELERAAGTLAGFSGSSPDHAPAEAPSSVQPTPQTPRIGRFRPTPWMRLK